MQWGSVEEFTVGESYDLLKNIYFYLFLCVYLVVLGLSCSSRDLYSLLRHAESLVGMNEIEFPDQGSQSAEF